MIVAKDTLGTINTHVISGLFKINKIQTTKMFTLKTITKSNTSFIYHIEVKVADETYFVEKYTYCFQIIKKRSTAERHWLRSYLISSKKSFLI